MGGGDDPLPPQDPVDVNCSTNSGPDVHVDDSITAPGPNVVASEARASTVMPEATAVPSTASVRSSVATAEVTCSVESAGAYSSVPDGAPRQDYRRVGADPGIFGVDEAYQPEVDDEAERNPFEGLMGAASTIFGGRQVFPDYLDDEARTAAQEEMGFARGALSARADEWRVEKEKAKAERRSPDLGVKFIYAWTLTKHPGGSERRLGCSLLQALLEDDNYEYPDECAYGLAHTHYLHGELRAARYFCESLLRMKPDSERAQRLHALVRMATSQKQDKALEFAAVGGTIFLGVAGLALAFAAGGKGKR